MEEVNQRHTGLLLDPLLRGLLKARCMLSQVRHPHCSWGWGTELFPSFQLLPDANLMLSCSATVHAEESLLLCAPSLRARGEGTPPQVHVSHANTQRNIPGNIHKFNPRQ